jgi:hypothetical protein
MVGDHIPARADESGSANRTAWLTDYEQARGVSRQKNKPIFVVFRCQH